MYNDSHIVDRGFILYFWRSFRHYIPLIRLVTMVIAIFFFALSSVLYVYYISRTTLINELTYAAKVGNINSFNKRTDWNSIKSSLKADLKARMKSVLGKTSGYAMPDEAIDAMVDYYVTPANIPTLFYYKNKYHQEVPPEDFIRAVEFNSLSEFTLDLALPAQTDKPWLAYMEPVRVVFILDGVDWKIKKIITPLYTLPKHSPTSISIRKMMNPHEDRLLQKTDSLSYSPIQENP